MIQYKKKVLGLNLIFDTSEAFKFDVNLRFKDNPIFLEALNDYMDDPERHNLTHRYWFTQFGKIKHELDELEEDLRKKLFSEKTKDYSQALNIARKIMNGEDV